MEEINIYEFFVGEWEVGSTVAVSEAREGGDQRRTGGASSGNGEGFGRSFMMLVDFFFLLFLFLDFWVVIFCLIIHPTFVNFPQNSIT